MLNYRKEFKETLIEKYNYDDNKGGYVSIYDTYYDYEKGKNVNDDLMLKIMDVFESRDKKIHQEIFDLVINLYKKEKKSRKYFTRKNPNGYGYEVLERTSKKSPMFNLLFHSYDIDKTKTVYNILKDETFEDFPDTSDEIPPVKILLIGGKHGNLFFRVDTPEKFKEKVLEILTVGIEHYYSKPSDYNWQNTLGMNEDTIMKLPDGTIKDFAIKEIKYHKDLIDGQNEHNKNWKILDKIIKDGVETPIQTMNRMLIYFEGFENVEIIEPQ